MPSRSSRTSTSALVAPGTDTGNAAAGCCSDADPLTPGAKARRRGARRPRTRGRRRTSPLRACPLLTLGRRILTRRVPLATSVRPVFATSNTRRRVQARAVARAETSGPRSRAYTARVVCVRRPIRMPLRRSAASGRRSSDAARPPHEGTSSRRRFVGTSRVTGRRRRARGAGTGLPRRRGAHDPRAGRGGLLGPRAAAGRRPARGAPASRPRRLAARGLRAEARGRERAAQSASGGRAARGAAPPGA